MSVSIHVKTFIYYNDVNVNVILSKEWYYYKKKMCVLNHLKKLINSNL
jgi:hypothetical protein